MLRPRSMLIILAIGASALAAPGTAERERRYFRLCQAVWKRTVSENEIAAIKEGLKETRPEFLLPAVLNAVAHRRRELIPYLKDLQVKNRSVVVAKVASASLDSDIADASGAFRDAARAQPRSSPTRSALTAIAVQLQVRDMRFGVRKKPDLEGLELTDYERLLVECAEMSSADAVSSLVRRMEALKLINKPWSKVLESYGEQGWQAAIDRLNENSPPPSKYGTIALLRTLVAGAMVGSPAMRRTIRDVARRYQDSEASRVKKQARGLLSVLVDTERLEEGK